LVLFFACFLACFCSKTDAFLGWYCSLSWLCVCVCEMVLILIIYHKNEWKMEILWLPRVSENFLTKGRGMVLKTWSIYWVNEVYFFDLYEMVFIVVMGLHQISISLWTGRRGSGSSHFGLWIVVELDCLSWLKRFCFQFEQLLGEWSILYYEEKSVD
jgi:hypothetical protein